MIIKDIEQFSEQEGSLWRPWPLGHIELEHLALVENNHGGPYLSAEAVAYIVPMEPALPPRRVSTMVHIAALRFKNGREWDVINGFRQN